MDNKQFKEFFLNPDRIVKKYFYGSKYCLAHSTKTCSGKIVDAHTISKKYLREISKKSHVYYPSSSFFNQKNLYEFKLQGINKCSTFSGFCQYHDSYLFSSFENKLFVGKYKQIYDYSYRIIAREYFQKKCLLKLITQLLSGKVEGCHLMTQEQKELTEKNKIFTAKSVSEHRLIYEGIKKSHSTGIKFIQLKLKKLPIATTGVLFPATDCYNQLIQSEIKKQQGIVYFILPVRDYSYLYIVYPNTNKTKVQSKYANSILNSLKFDEHTGLMNYFLSAFLDNNDIVALSPCWYQSLSESFINDIDYLMNRRVGQFFQEEYQWVNIVRFDQNIDFQIISQNFN